MAAMMTHVPCTSRCYPTGLVPPRKGEDTERVSTGARSMRDERPRELLSELIGVKGFISTFQP